ncbi:MAG TPA: serine/threonine-protein kinase [Kofleriaceae bacterium]
MGAPDRELAAGDGTPRWLGKYEVLRLLGRGGMAEVYLGRATGIEGFEKLVALKRMLPQHAEDPALVALFLEEARIAATLDHPNVVHVHDIGQDSGGYFFAMEFVHGADALRLLRAAARAGQTLPLDVGLTLATGACGGLHHAHEKRDLDGTPRAIVHCDVSPSNLLATFEGAVKVTDFGIAKALRTAPTAQMTAPRGKRGYMSPEQCVGAPLDRRSDVFSLGVVLYEFTTGRPMFDRTGDADLPVLERITRGALRPPSEVVSGYPLALERIVLRAVAVAPPDRYQTAQELQLDLEAFARDQRLAVSPVTVARCLRRMFGDEVAAWEEARQSGVGLGEHLTRTVEVPAATGDTTVPATPRAQRGRRRWPIAIAFFALLALAGGAAFAMWRGADEPAASRPVAPARPASPVVERTAPAAEPAPPPAETPAAEAPPGRSSAKSRRPTRRRDPDDTAHKRPPALEPPPAWERDGLSPPP